MGNMMKAKDVRLITQGILVSRATATIPQSTSTSIFTVSGGRILLKAMVGEVTTVIGGTTVNFNITYTPTGGSAADLCAATACTSDAVGTLYSIVSGVASDLLSIQNVSSLGTGGAAASDVPNVTFAQILRQPIVLDTGAFKFKTSASTTGAVKWDMIYVPFDDGASVVAN